MFRGRHRLPVDAPTDFESAAFLGQIGADDVGKTLRLQRSATYQKTVNVVKGENGLGVVRLYASAI